MADVAVRDLAPTDHDWARGVITRLQGSPQVARLGQLIDPLAIEGLLAEADGQPVGLASVHETDKGLEVVLLIAEPPGIGAGTALLETARQVASASGHHRLWLVTTNDNLPAIHFYLRRGLRVAAVHEGAVNADRALKPEIPEVNSVNGLPIRDLIELELTGDALDRRLETTPFAALDDLDRLPAAAFVTELAPLVEGAPRFLERLALERPFGSDEALLAAAFEIAHGLPEEEQVELIDSHPRIGADAESVSELSYVEQGYGDEGAGDEEEALEDREETLAQLAADTARAYEELAMLNGIYEERFGFRYVVFVAGRPKTEIVPLLEHALRNDRDVELRRAVDDAIYIAGDRLRRLRGLGTEV
ncbi:MAG TPA: GNAT family N-acetyltransferase [Candidatus Limnocylindria bacterium]|nr:GNAT family N-acetyltransferase [Candidatus Limnocylindria bacterium]